VVLGDRDYDTQPQFIAVSLGAKRKTISDSLLLLLQAYGRMRSRVKSSGEEGGVSGGMNAHRETTWVSLIE
jgi:hypothetical protein